MPNKWDENTDYQALIDAAVQSGDYASAARNEQYRNQKIDATGLPYAKTHEYEGYLDYNPDADYEWLADYYAKNGDWSGAWGALYGDKYSRSAKQKDYGETGRTNEDIWGDISAKYGWSYASNPNDVKSRQEKIDALYDQIMGRGDFSYDPETDPLYESYRKRYTREGDRAMEDVLSSAAGMTGGIPSSYAVTAAQETSDNYMEKLQDVLPQLYEIAYGHWQDEGNNMRQNLSLLQAEDQQDYNRGRDNINYRLAREQEEYERERAREQEAYEREKDNRAILEDHAKTMAAVGDFSGYKALGYTDEEIAKLQQAWLLQQAAAGGSGGGGGGGRRGGSGRSGKGSSSYDVPTNQKVRFANGQTMTQRAQSKSITNQHAYYNGELSWMVIPGHGRMSAREVSNYIQSGKIKETKNKNGSYTYTWKG